MSVINDTAAVIKTTVLTVANVGQVYDYQPAPVNGWDQFVAHFTATIDSEPRVRAVTIQYLGERRQERNVAIGSAALQMREMDWMVRVHVGWENPTSDALFRTLVENIADAIDKNRDLSGVAGVIDHDPVDILLPGNGAGVLLGDVLCHYAEVTFTSYHEQGLTLT